MQNKNNTLDQMNDIRNGLHQQSLADLQKIARNLNLPNHESEKNKDKLVDYIRNFSILIFKTYPFSKLLLLASEI